MGVPLYPSVNRFFFNPDFGINMVVNGELNPISFDLTPPENTIYTVWDIKFSFITPWHGEHPLEGTIVQWDKFMDQSALPNGIVIQDTKDGEINFEVTIKNNADLIILPISTWNIPFRDTTYVMVEIKFNFNPNTPIRMSSMDFNRITIRDDLTSLIQFTGSARGTIFLINP